MSIVLNGDSGITTPTYGGADTSEYLVPVTAFKNRIINGAMVIDQRNAGASVTPTTNLSYTLDRWSAVLTVASKYSVQQNAGSVTPPAGYTNYLGVTSLSAYSVGSGDLFQIRQPIEGYNISDLAFGTANAKTVTLSFWVRSSLTGTFGGCLNNSAGDRNYLFTYTISSANTWEQKTVTIAGDTSGTWLTTNGSGIEVRFGLGAGSTYSGSAGTWTSSAVYQPTGATSVVGTNGATFYITGVQLEVGSTATSFDTRSYGTELQLCQRYVIKFSSDSNNTNTKFGLAFCYSTAAARCVMPFPVQMRSYPSLTTTSTASQYGINYAAGGDGTCSALPTINVNTGTLVGCTEWTLGSGLTAGQAVMPQANGNNTAYLLFTAEL